MEYMVFYWRYGVDSIRGVAASQDKWARQEQWRNGLDGTWTSHWMKNGQVLNQVRMNQEE